jgi:hypothetical protein
MGAPYRNAFLSEGFDQLLLHSRLRWPAHFICRLAQISTGQQ